MSEPLPDPRLKAALAHAPDRDGTAPPALSATILAAARRDAQPRPRWSAWLESLRQPAATAALATLLLGTTVLLLWRGEVPPQALPDGGPAAAVEPAPSSVPPALPASPPAVAAHPPAPAVPAAIPPPTAHADSGSRDSTGSTAAEAAAAPPIVPVPSPALARRRAAMSEDGSALSAPGAAGDPLAPLLPRLSAPVREAAAALQQAAAGRWQVTSQPMPAAAIVVRDGNDQPIATLHLAEDHVLWQGSGPLPPVWRADLEPAALAAMRERWKGSGRQGP